ncbi:MAG: hypothetical protein MZV65_52170 [Chromatiales bacterium]|nr:hypothetical protein [Chromatiales bacterium]
MNFLTQDGYTTGRLAGVDIDGHGRAARPLHQRPVAGAGPGGAVELHQHRRACKPAGRHHLGRDLARPARRCAGAPGTASLGLIQSGALEESNVDLTEQLVDMITAQRNFQANAQVIRPRRDRRPSSTPISSKRKCK